MVRPAFDLASASARILGDPGDVQLPSLTREELHGVGDDPLLANAADSLWWDGLSEREQELVLETAQRGLVARNLLVPDGEGDMVATDEVLVVVAARAAPDWAMVLGEPGVTHDSDGAPLQLALLALPSQSGSSPGVLVSARVEGVYLHRLVATAKAYDVAADWLLRAVEGEGAEIARTVELLAPVDQELRSVRGLVVGRDDARFLSQLESGEPGEPVAVDLVGLADWIRGHLGSH